MEQCYLIVLMDGQLVMCWYEGVGVGVKIPAGTKGLISFRILCILFTVMFSWLFCCRYDYSVSRRRTVHNKAPGCVFHSFLWSIPQCTVCTISPAELNSKAWIYPISFDQLYSGISVYGFIFTFFSVWILFSISFQRHSSVFALEVALEHSANSWFLLVCHLIVMLPILWLYCGC